MVRKKKEEQQPLFIEFVNCPFEKIALLNFFDNTLKDFYPERTFSYFKKPLEYEMLFEKCFEQEREFIKEKMAKTFLKMLEGDKRLWINEMLEEGETETTDLNLSGVWVTPFLEKKMGVTLSFNYNDPPIPPKLIRKEVIKTESGEWEKGEILRDWPLDKKSLRVLDFFSIVHQLASLQFILKEILLRVMDSKPLEEQLLKILNTIILADNTKLVLGEKTYLKKIAVKDEGGKFRIIIYNELIEFLCTPDWIKLHQCEECKKFFVAKTKVRARFCSVKCKNDFNNRERRKSGKNTEDQRKWKEKNPGCY
ncbi:MAG: hypothetical protein JW902_05060 [Syntrophaceae bacterium]|nr:hypothetical protein [Syntrophaceae bacterium]